MVAGGDEVLVEVSKAVVEAGGADVVDEPAATGVVAGGTVAESVDESTGATPGPAQAAVTRISGARVRRNSIPLWPPTVPTVAFCGRHPA